MNTETQQQNEVPQPPPLTQGRMYVEVDVNKELPTVSTYYLCIVEPKGNSLSEQAEVFFYASSNSFSIPIGSRFSKVKAWLKPVPHTPAPAENQENLWKEVAMEFHFDKPCHETVVEAIIERLITKGFQISKAAVNNFQSLKNKTTSALVKPNKYHDKNP